MSTFCAWWAACWQYHQLQMGGLAGWITVLRWHHAQILIPFHAGPGVVRMLQWVQGQQFRALLPPFFWGWKGRLILSWWALQWLCSGVWAGGVCWATELVVLSPGHSHLDISIWLMQCWEGSALYLFLSILDVAGRNVKCVINFVPHPPSPKRKSL